MLISPKNNISRFAPQDKQCIFDIDRYRFSNFPQNIHEYVKTCTNRKITKEDINNIAKLHHPNLIALKKISKSKKSGEDGLFWLYYETIPFSLELVFLRTNFDITCQAVEAALISIKNYLMGIRICPEFHQLNIGIDQKGVIKIYLSIENMLKYGELSHKQLITCENKINQIRKWRSYKPNQLPKSISEKQLLSSNINKIQQIKQDLQKLRKQMKSQQSKNGSIFDHQTPNKANFRNNNFVHQQQFPMNHINPIDYRLLLKTQNPIQKHNRQSKHIVKYPQQYDNQSVDTYQMEMGEDFQMPSIRTDQKLRQTVINNKKSWDTLTHKAPASNKKKVCESAGNTDFKNIIESNKKILKESALKRLELISDNKTVQENLRQKTWQSSTIKSTLPPNIQDRVQQALAKTKNVMEKLKNTKSFSAGK